MKLGNKNVRYAVVVKNGHKREVVGAKTGNKEVIYNKPKETIRIKNNGSDNAITLYNKDTKGSYIVKDTDKNISDYCWITNNKEITIPADEEITTHLQTANKGLSYIPNGNFEVSDWSNCDGTKLVNAFHHTETNDSNKQYFDSKGLTKVPEQWPVGCTSVAYALKNSGITEIPNWSNLKDTCTIATEAIAGTTINDLKIDNLKNNLNVVTKANKFLNNVKLENFTFSPYSHEFYDLYTTLKSTCVEHTDFFGASKPTYTVKFKHNDGDKEAYVIHPDLMYIPEDWGGFSNDELTGFVDNVEVDQDCSKLMNITKRARWSLSTYGNDYYTITNNKIENFIDFYSSTVIVVEMSGYGQTHYYVFDKNTPNLDCSNVHLFDMNPGSGKQVEIYFNDDKASLKPFIPNGVEFTYKIHVFMKTDPYTSVEAGTNIVNNGIGPYWEGTIKEGTNDLTNTTLNPGSFKECFLSDGSVYEGKFIIEKPVEEDFDIANARIVNITHNETTDIISWNTVVLIDNEDQYIDNTEGVSWTYEYNNVVTPLDTNRLDVSSWNDGSYNIIIRACKNDKTTSPYNFNFTIKGYDTFWPADLMLMQFEGELTEQLIWHISKKLNGSDEYTNIDESISKSSIWLYKANSENVYEGYNIKGKTSNSTNITTNNFSIADEYYTSGKYRIDVCVYSKADNNKYPERGVISAYLTKKSSAETWTTTEITNNNIPFIVYTPNRNINISSYSFFSTDARSMSNTVLKIIGQYDDSLDGYTTGKYKTVAVCDESINITNFIDDEGNAIIEHKLSLKNNLTLNANTTYLFGAAIEQWNSPTNILCLGSEHSTYQITGISPHVLKDTTNSQWLSWGTVDENIGTCSLEIEEI